MQLRLLSIRCICICTNSTNIYCIIAATWFFFFRRNEMQLTETHFATIGTECNLTWPYPVQYAATFIYVPQFVKLSITRLDHIICDESPAFSISIREMNTNVRLMCDSNNFPNVIANEIFTGAEQTGYEENAPQRRTTIYSISGWWHQIRIQTFSHSFTENIIIFFVYHGCVVVRHELIFCVQNSSRWAPVHNKFSFHI